jgi:hypothetical protein
MARVAFVVGDYPSEESTRREKVALSYSNAEVGHGGLRRRKSIYHAMPGWNACPRLRRIECQIAISG